MRVVLASASPRRQELLKLIVEAFEVMVSAVDETLPTGVTPAEAVQQLAQRKALAVLAQAPDALVIGADTVVVLDGDILGKPADKTEAAAMLRRLSGRTHVVYTGVAIAKDGSYTSFVESAEVTFATLDERKIAAYLATGEPMDKAGAYGIQGKGALFVRGIHGDFYTVMGLPVCRLAETLEQDDGFSLRM